MFTRALAVFAVLGLLSGCAGNLKTDYDLDRERVASYVAAHPELDAETAAAIRAHQLRSGMTMEQVVASWGRPATVRRYRDGALQVWYFGCNWRHLCSTPDERWPMPEEIYHSRAYFENGRLVDFNG